MNQIILIILVAIILYKPQSLKNNISKKNIIITR